MIQVTGGPVKGEGRASEPEGPPRFLLVHPPTPELKEFAQVLRSFTHSVEIVSGLSDISTDATYDVLLIHYEGLSPAERAALLDQHPVLSQGKRIIFLS